MTTFYSILMSINAICAVSILLSGISRKKSYFLALAALNVLLIAFHWISLELVTSNNIVLSQQLSKWHLMCVILGFPFYVFIFGQWTEFKHTKSATLTFAILSVPLLVLNFTSQSSLRYGDNPDIVSYTTIFKDQAYILVGESGAYFSYIHLGYGFIAGFLVFSAFRFYKREQTALSVVLILTILLQIATSYIGYQIDRQQSALVYVGGVPMTLLSFFVVCFISSGFKKKSSSLHQQLIEKESLHNVFSKLAGISNEEGQNNFYQETLSILSAYSNADFILFGLVNDIDKQNITTQVAFKNNQLIENFSYQIEGSPCENVLFSHACIHKAKVAEDFPKDIMLEDESIEAYIGYPIVGADKYNIGVLALLFKAPLNNEQTLKTVTDVFATRINAELRQEALKNELKATAYIDYLTQLPNRIKLLGLINSVKNNAALQDSQALLLLFDLDNFGEINRKYGYEVGDKVMKVVGERLRSYATKGVFIARCSGDEFAVVISKLNTDISKITEVHWTAIKAIINATCYIGSRKINISCSMGAVVFPSQLQSNLDVVGSAEHALLQAKQQGRNTYAFFDPALLFEMQQARELEADLIHALKGSDGLEVFYQPKVDKLGNLVGAEALLRWFSKKRGFVSPVEFIPIAEESGIIHDLGNWVLKSVLNDMCEWKINAKHLVPISINITASQFEDDEFIGELICQIDAFDVPCNLIELELTESGLLIDKNKAIETLTKIRASGITIALDDFGTGYSSLSYLSELPLDVLKIDKSFVDGLANEQNKEIVKSIIAISQAMGLSNVAEGTEDLEQVELLASFGCEYFQGYYFSKPINKSDFASWLK